MKYSTKTGSLAKTPTPCLVCSHQTAQRVARDLGHADVLATATQDFTDSAGSHLLVQLPKSSTVKRLLVAGGADEHLNADAFRKVVRGAAQRLADMECASALWALSATTVEDSDVYWRTFVGLYELSNALYRFDEHKSGNSKARRINRVQVHADARSRASVQRAVSQAQALKAGLDLARDLGNQPPNVCNPTYLLRAARRLGQAPNVTVSALDERRMTELGMGAFMAVSRGSDTPGKMIIVNYKGAKSKTPPVVLIGKGITFDTGGISLKPPAAMDEMKFDMCGAASVLGVTRAAIDAKLPLNLVTIVAAAENMPSGKATRPGDIVTTHSGKTVEILNTDAEGRLVLCDALSYAARYRPGTVIDVATLTGAVIVALGSHASAVYANDDELAHALVDAGDWTGDRGWHLPMWDDYQSGLRSPFADVANVGGRDAGSIVAACFLSRFAEDYTWAHLDIAGSAFRGGTKKGATGRPVALLFRYLSERA